MPDLEFNIQYFKEVESTMDIVRDAAHRDEPSGLCVWAGQQLSGRGRRGNIWVSPPGNLYTSLLLRPEKPLAEWGQMAFIVGLAARASTAALYPEFQAKIKLKWPNDLILEGQKLAGLLLEAGQDQNNNHYLIIGFGMNVLSAPEERTSLSGHLDLNNEDEEELVKKLLLQFLNQLQNYIKIWEKEGFAPIRAEWLMHAYGLGTDITARLTNEDYDGRFAGLDPNGALLLEENSGITRKIHAGEVFWHSL